MKLSIVIPAFNEAATLENILERVTSAPLPSGLEREIIVVDDASTDGSADRLRAYAARNPLIVAKHHERNRGKGAALRTGFDALSGEVVVIQDADLEYDPREYAKLLQPILDDRADVVYGSRFLGGETHRVLYYWHYLGNRFLTFLSNCFTNLNLTDMEVGYKVFRAEVLRRIRIEESRFGFEPEITAKVARLGCRVYEVGISYSGRTYLEGKKINWTDGVRAIWCILKYNLWRR